MQTTQVAERRGWLASFTRYQGLVFLVCWLGWTLDIINFTLFALVLRPALTDLLGGHAGIAEIGRIGGWLSTVGLLGWAFGGFLFGIISDYIGRVRTLAISIAIYSVFTAMQGFAQTPLQLGVYRFPAGSAQGQKSSSASPW